MPIPRLDPDRAALLVIDMQEKLLRTIVDRERIITNCRIMIQATGELDIPHLVTEYYPSGLGRTVDSIQDVMRNPAARVEKTRFSALVDVVDDIIRGWGRTQILVSGIEANVCVLQTVLDLQTSGRQCFVLTDAISASQRDQIEPACRRMEAAGATPSGVMASTYELLGDAQHPARRSCVELMKDIAI